MIVAGPHVISGSARSSTISGGRIHVLESDLSVIAGGYNNQIGSNSTAAIVGGGIQNMISFGCWHSLISGGNQNLIGQNSLASSIGGGEGNWVREGSFGNVIAGGSGNQIGPDVVGACISGGFRNSCTAMGATVAGGSLNQAAGDFAAVPGGSHNVASARFSLAAGYGSQALHQGALVWADAAGREPSPGTFEPIRFTSLRTNEFAARATGGVRFVTAIDTNGAPTALASLAPGSGSWSSVSDRNAKENFTPTQSREVLDKVAALPIATWNYKSQDKSIRHMGPTAQDFHATFNVGENDRTITTVDADGVALAAIQGLNQKLEHELKAKAVQIRQLEADLAELKQLLRTLISK